MLARKYVKDYRLEDKLDARGKLRTELVYIGGEYVFCAPERAGGRYRRAALLLNVLSWLCFIGALLPHSLATNTMYCVLPFVACVMTLIYETAAVIVAMTAREPLKREQADRLSGRLPITALLTLIFSGVAFGGCVVNAVRAWDALLPGDAVFSGLAALLAACSAVLMRLAQGFRAVKKEDSVY